MEGEIGSLVQDGKQIGGFLDWTIDLTLTSVERPQGREYKRALVKATANKYWVLCEPLQGEITALYYKLIGDKLALVNQAQVMIKLGKTLDKVLNIPIEMIWIT